jgi:hemerythrin-like domain-containing protein
MISYNELYEEIHHITELSNILSYLFKDRDMCDTRTCCDLFNNYIDLVNKHIDLVDRNFYSDLLKSPDSGVNTVANNFMSGSVEVKRIIKACTKQWCTLKNDSMLKIDDHQQFVKDTDQLFDIILQRIQDETEHLYPMVRKLKQA